MKSEVEREKANERKGPNLPRAAGIVRACVYKDCGIGRDRAFTSEAWPSTLRSRSQQLLARVLFVVSVFISAPFVA